MSETLRLWFAVGGVAATVFSITNLYFRFHEKANAHATLGARYGIVRRRIEVLASVGASSIGINYSIEAIEAELDELSKMMPVVPTFIFERTRKELNQKGDPDFVSEVLAPVSNS